MGVPLNRFCNDNQEVAMRSNKAVNAHPTPYPTMLSLQNTTPYLVVSRFADPEKPFNTGDIFAFQLVSSSIDGGYFVVTFTDDNVLRPDMHRKCRPRYIFVCYKVTQFDIGIHSLAHETLQKSVNTRIESRVACLLSRSQIRYPAEIGELRA